MWTPECYVDLALVFPGLVFYWGSTVKDMDVDVCPRCGAPLAPTAPGATKTCRFCGAEGRLRPVADRAALAPVPERKRVCVPNETVETLFERYVASLRACAKKSLGDEAPDEHLLRAVEDKMDIPDKRRLEFRQEVMNLVEALTTAGRPFEPGTNRRIAEALEAIVAEDVGGS